MPEKRQTLRAALVAGDDATVARGGQKSSDDYAFLGHPIFTTPCININYFLF